MSLLSDTNALDHISGINIGLKYRKTDSSGGEHIPQMQSGFEEQSLDACVGDTNGGLCMQKDCRDCTTTDANTFISTIVKDLLDEHYQLVLVLADAASDSTKCMMK